MSIKYHIWSILKILRRKVQAICGCYTNVATVAPSTVRGIKHGGYHPPMVVKMKTTAEDGTASSSLATKSVRFETNDGVIAGAEAASAPKLPYTTIHLKLQGMHCDGCKQKVVKALTNLDEVMQFDISIKRQKVDVSGFIDPEKVIEAIQKSTGKQVEYWASVDAGLCVPANDHQPHQEDPYAEKSLTGAEQAVRVQNPAPGVSDDGDALKLSNGESLKADCKLEHVSAYSPCSSCIGQSSHQAPSTAEEGEAKPAGKDTTPTSPLALNPMKEQVLVKTYENIEPKQKQSSYNGGSPSHAAGNSMNHSAGAEPPEDSKPSHGHAQENSEHHSGVDLEASTSLPSSEELTRDGSNIENNNRNTFASSLISSAEAFLQELLTAGLVKTPREAINKQPTSMTKQDAANDQCCRDRTTDESDPVTKSGKRRQLSSFTSADAYASSKPNVAALKGSKDRNCSHKEQDQRSSQRHQLGKSDGGSGIVSQSEKFLSSVTDVLVLLRRDSAPAFAPNCNDKLRSRQTLDRKSSRTNAD